MTRPRKPIPKTAFDISQEQVNPYITNEGKPVNETKSNRNRGTDYSFKNDTVKDISIGLQDIDEAIMYYFNEVIKPTVIQDSNRAAVRTIYASPERWKSIQADGFYRDGNGQATVPLIVIRRENVEKVRNIGNKIDGNSVALYQVIGTKYNSRNQYDKFSILNNRIPSEQYYVSSVPDYLTLTYNCIIFTDFVEQNNKIVEAIEFASDSYWGDPARYKFRASIDSFATTNIVENGQDKAAKSTFSLKVNGYIIPDTVNKDLATVRSKFYTKSQVIFDLEVVDGGITTNIDTTTFANKAPAQNAGGSTSFVGGGVNVTNNITNISSAAAGDLTYLNTNKTLQATTVTVPNTAVFTGAILQPPAGSTLPATTVNNFVFYINGQYVPSSLVTLTPGSGIVTAVFNTTGLGYTLEADDEVIAIGKWQ
jgi:hypothetical protein